MKRTPDPGQPLQTSTPYQRFPSILVDSKSYG
ncbi:hypothetical protein AVEN_111380-1, partial [Araneus ventricosus]